MNLKFYHSYESLVEQCHPKNDSIFRGHSNSGAFWKICSSYFRNRRNGYSHFFRRKRSLGPFMKRFSELSEFANSDKFTDIQILAMLQHYGVPTPLIDFTKDVRIALYFAASEINYAVRTRDEHLISRKTFYDRNGFEGNDTIYNEAQQLNSKCVKNEDDENDLRQLFKFQKDYFVDVVEVQTSSINNYIKDLSVFAGPIDIEILGKNCYNLEVERDFREEVYMFSVLNPNRDWASNLSKQKSSFLFLDSSHDFELVFERLFDGNCIVHHLIPKAKLNYPDHPVTGHRNVNSYLKDMYGISGMTLFDDFQGVKYEYLNFETGN